MDFEEEGDDENVVQMATRLTKVLDYQQEMLSLKRRYVLEGWPENLKKHKMIGLPTEGCVPEGFIREEKEISGINHLVETAIATLHTDGSRNDCQLNSVIVDQSPEPPLSRVQEMSDLEAIKHVPDILCSLNKKALRTLFYTLNGRKSTTNHRYILEREIKKAFANLNLPSCEHGLPEVLLKIASVVRSLSSYRHSLGSTNPNVNFIPMMPSSALAAAHKAFACVKNFPTRIVMEVGKLLTTESNTNSPSSFRYKTHSRTVDVVNKEVEKVMNHLREDDPLPASLDGALRVISLSARIFLGNDGGLAGLLNPLPAEKLALEREFLAAYNQIKKLDDVNLSRVCHTLGKGAVWPPFRKQQHIDELQRLLIDSMHCIYASNDFPGHVKKAIHMINDTISKKGRRIERVNAEIDAALNVSAAMQSAVWELYDSFHGQRPETADERTFLQTRNDTEPSAMNICLAEAKTNHLSSTSTTDLNRPSSENNQHAVKIEMEIPEDEVPDGDAVECMASSRVQQDSEHYAQDVERFSDDAAVMVYVIIGCLLKETVMQRSFFVDQTKLGYLQTGLDKLQHCSALASNLPGDNTLPGCPENLNADELVLCIAKQLKAIPKSVISEIELRMGLRWH